MTGDQSHREPRPTGDFRTETRHCEVCEDATRHAVEGRQYAGVTALLYTCEQCHTMNVEPQREAFVMYVNTDARQRPSSAHISFSCSA